MVGEVDASDVARCRNVALFLGASVSTARLQTEIALVILTAHFTHNVKSGDLLGSIVLLEG